LYEEKAGADSRKKELLREKEEVSHQLAQWREKYGSHDELIEKLGDLQYTRRKLQAELDDLPSLPEGYVSAEDFIRHVEELEETQAQLGEELSDLHQKRARLEGRAPDSSSEELEGEIAEAESVFERVKQEAEVLLRVREESLRLVDSLDGETYSRLEDSFVRRLSQISGQRFRGVLMEQDMPERFITEEDRRLPFELLSHGTKGTAALAWRFALCEHFLGDAPGTIVLDDPLVDMDPKRRASAAAGIEEFAENHQVLLLTCHPTHADIMNSPRVHTLSWIVGS
ncbi:MAG: ATP-binding protein, partial [Spirochaetaceae bacterium]